jgi:hypothetical protein
MVLHDLYLWVQVLLMVIVAEASLHHALWYQRLSAAEVKDTLRYHILGDAIIGFTLLGWLVSIFVFGISKRELPDELALALTILLLTGYSLVLVPQWVIDMKMTSLKVAQCIATRGVLAAGLVFVWAHWP